MPDWIAHVLVAWSCGKLLQLKEMVSKKDVALLMLGAVLPDINAIDYLFCWAGIDFKGSLFTFHTIAGALTAGALISLMFKDSRKTFFLLAAGALSHFALDALLLHVGKGMVLLFPFSWMWGFQLGWIPSDSWIPTLVITPIALVVFLLARGRK